MPFVLRFIQRYRPAERAAFLALEAKFAAMERRRADMPKGRRSQLYAGREAANASICEFDFATLSAVQDFLTKLAGDKEHEELLARQAPFMTDTFTEIYEVLEL